MSKHTLIMVLCCLIPLVIFGVLWAVGVSGDYRWVGHPQYSGLFPITVGMLIQWPMIITIAMWPVLMLMYYRLARREEIEMESRFGDQYVTYRQRVPMFWPRLAAVSRTTKAETG